jgi:predicted nuclease of predicted toxin-antitoxin system
MKILIDQNISFKVKYAIRSDFPDSNHVSDFGMNNKDDQEIWQFAKDNQYTILTYDADFFDLSMVLGHPPKIIWVREGNLSTSALITLILSNVPQILSFMQNHSKQAASCIEIIG